MDLLKLEYKVIKNIGIQPSEIENMEFYRLEYYIKFFEEDQEEEKKQHENEKNNYSKYNPKVDYNQLSKQFTPFTNNFKNVSNFKPPKL